MEQALITQLRILKLSDLKPNFSELARQYELDRRTVKKYYDGYEGKPANHYKPSKLDPYKDIIADKLSIKGTKIRSVYEYILAEKNPDIGSYSNFLKYVHRNMLTSKHTPKGHPRFETAPGKQAQADWKEDLKLTSRNGTIFTIQVFDYKLGHSRYCHYTLKQSRTQQDVFDCLIDAFIQTGGVPDEILFDNMTSIVDWRNGRRHVSERFKAFTKDLGFKAKFAKPYSPYTKGKVETINKFLNRLLPYQGEFEGLDDLKQILAKINKTVNQERCQATNVPPLLLFQKEKEHLRPLPSKAVIESYMSHDRQTKVQSDSLIIFNSHKYSVPPAYIGKQVTLKVSDDNKLHIYCSTELIAIHDISEKQLNYLPEHYTALLATCLQDSDKVMNLAEQNLRQMDALL